MPAFFYLDLADARRRAALLTLAVRKRKPTLANLKREYAHSLAQIGKMPLNTGRTLRVVSGGPILRVARARRLVDSSVSPSTYSAESRTAAVRGVQHSLLFLGLQHPPLHEMCELLITDILVWPSITVAGGSSARLLGIAWLVPSADQTTLDIAESVVHEMVHLNLHLAEMTFGLYTRAPGSYFEAHSAVLGRRRPYHHAFHSACVAVAVIYYRLLLGLHGDMESLCSSLRRCTSELLRHPSAFSEYAWKAILAAHAFSRDPRIAAIPVHRQLRGQHDFLQARGPGLGSFKAGN